MSGKLQLRSPRSEVSRALPCPLPAGRADGTQSLADGIAAVEDFLERQLDRLRQAATEGRSVDQIALTMLEPGPDGHDPLPGAGPETGAPDETPGAAVLAALGTVDESRVGGLLGLAVLAVRSGRIDLAYELALACLDAEPKHPRAYSIAGVCELERGNSESARAYLAAAARIARQNPDYHEELKIAQRSLLLMHLP